MTNAQQLHFALKDLQYVCSAAEAQEHPACRSHLGTNNSHLFNLNIDFHLKVANKYWAEGIFHELHGKREIFFPIFTSQLNISGHQCCFLYITDVALYPQMMPYIDATALSMDGNSLEWEIRKNHQPTTNYSQVFLYLKGKWPSSDKRKKKNLKQNGQTSNISPAHSAPQHCTMGLLRYFCSIFWISFSF